MKYLLLLLLLPSVLFAQKDTLVSYSDVVQAPNVSQEQLFIRARQWFNETFVSSKAVLQIADKETGELAGKAIAHITGSYKFVGKIRDYPFTSEFACNIWAKDGKYKYEFKSFYITDEADMDIGILTSKTDCNCKIAYLNTEKSNNLYLSLKKSNEERFKAIIAKLKNAMDSKSDSESF